MLSGVPKLVIRFRILQASLPSTRWLPKDRFPSLCPGDRIEEIGHPDPPGSNQRTGHAKATDAGGHTGCCQRTGGVCIDRLPHRRNFKASPCEVRWPLWERGGGRFTDVGGDLGDEVRIVAAGPE